MRDTDLFGLALGVEPPWVVRKSAFDGAAKRLDIYLDFARGSRFACPQCGAAGCPAYDSDEKTWRHLNFFQHEAYLHARVPRVSCTGCGIKQVEVPWARVDSGFTLLFEALVMAMVQAMPVAVVARMVEEWDTRLWRVIHHYVEAALDRVDHSEVTSAAARLDFTVIAPRTSAGSRPWRRLSICLSWSARHSLASMAAAIFAPRSA